MYDFYEYPKCSTCRKAKSTLDNLDIDYKAIDIKLNPPTAEQFEKWFAEVPVKKFFNTSGLVHGGRACGAYFPGGSGAVG